MMGLPLISLTTALPSTFSFSGSQLSACTLRGKRGGGRGFALCEAGFRAVPFVFVAGSSPCALAFSEVRVPVLASGASSDPLAGPLSPPVTFARPWQPLRT